MLEQFAVRVDEKDEIIRRLGGTILNVKK